MMTEEQIRELATLSANVRHLVGGMESLQRSIDGLEERVRNALQGLATRAELREFVTVTHHDAEVKAMGLRMDRIEKVLESQSPMSLWDKAVRIGVGITTFAAVVGLIWAARGA
jgi:hypothetical protein